MENTAVAQNEVLELDAGLEKSFNEALEDVRKSIGEDTSGEDEEGSTSKTNLSKAKSSESDGEEEEEDESEEEEDEEDEEKMSYRKSVEERLSEDPEAEAAMDVEPFLKALVKSIDGSIREVAKTLQGKVDKVEAMVKSQSKLMAATAELQKSIKDTTEKIGNMSIATKAKMRDLKKSRFDKDDPVGDFTGNEILNKSIDWTRKGKITIVEASKIEGRVNRGSLFRTGDALDKKVQTLLKAKEE